jgi:hypothetical protein
MQPANIMEMIQAAIRYCFFIIILYSLLCLTRDWRLEIPLTPKPSRGSRYVLSLDAYWDGIVPSRKKTCPVFIDFRDPVGVGKTGQVSVAGGEGKRRQSGSW